MPSDTKPIRRDAAQTASSARLIWVDAVKGAAIALVVFGHIWRGIHLRGIVPEGLFQAVDQRIYAFHMPVFFAASGFFLVQQVTRQSFGGFLTSRFRRLLWPLVLWTYLFLGLKLMAGSLANAPVQLEDLLILPIPGYLHFWFLWALFVQHILAYWGLRIGGREPPGLWHLAMLLLIALALGLIPWPGEVLYWFNTAFRFVPYLVIGMIMGRYLMTLRIPLFVTFGAALLFISIITFAPDLRSATGLFSIFCRMVLTVTFIAVIKGFVDAGAPSRALIVLGGASMAIYMTHTIFAAATREGLLVLGGVGLWPHILMGMLIGLVGPLGVLWAARRMRVAGFLGI